MRCLGKRTVARALQAVALCVALAVGALPVPGVSVADADQAAAEHPHAEEAQHANHCHRGIDCFVQAYLHEPHRELREPALSHSRITPPRDRWTGTAPGTDPPVPRRRA